MQFKFINHQDITFVSEVLSSIGTRFLRGKNSDIAGTINMFFSFLNFLEIRVLYKGIFFSDMKVALFLKLHILFFTHTYSLLPRHLPPPFQ